MATAKKEFKRKKIDGEFIQVKTLENGATIHKWDDECFSAYDKDGNCLGSFIQTQENAEYAASSGRVVNLDIDKTREDLLYQLWREAVADDCRVMQDIHGRQYIALGHSMFMCANRDFQDGNPDLPLYEVELLTDCEMDELHFDEDKHCFNLVVVPKDEAFAVE